MNNSAVTLVGNLTRDPELRFTTGGRAIANFGLAVNRRWQQNGEWQEQVSFFNVVAWGDLGENVATSMTKGSRAIVSGRLEQRSWDDSQGEKKSTVEVVADEIGPSLRWATCVIERTERGGGDGGYQGDRQPAGGGSRQPDPVYGDEEPF
jgi:single-strand DNA-binding protein